MKTILSGVLGASLLVSPAFAQSPSGAPSAGAWNGLDDRFQIDTGYFRLSADTVLRYNGSRGSGDVSLENDLGVSANANTFWVDTTWRVGRRHQLKLAYTRFTRDRADYTLQRAFTWGGDYNAGLSATTTSGSDILGGYYPFAAYRNDRFEIGPTIGLGYLWISAGIRATGTIGGVTRSLDQSASTGSITGAIGGYANGWLTKRLVARADYLYIKVKPGDSEASVTDWRLGELLIFRNAGLGVQYKYNKYSYDRGILVSQLGGQVTFQGGQIFLTFLF